VDPGPLAARYVALWSEPDPEARRRAIRALWADGGAQLLHPPQLVRDAAGQLGFPHVALEARGYAALEARVTRSYDELVGSGRFSFEPLGEPVQLGDAVRLRWVARSRADGAVAGEGLDLLLLDEDGRIRVDYQFVER
jgi:hypothetical protein